MPTKISQFFSRYKWELLGILLIIFVVLVNRFPEGYVIAGEDTFQHINLGSHYEQLFYEWQGRVSLFYGFFYGLDLIGVTETAQASWYLGVFLLGAYLSFIAFLHLFLGKIDSRVRVLSALFYALNLYTLYVFTYTWGYSDFQMLYVFLPALVGTYIAFLQSENRKYGVYFLGLLFLASTGFANPAFALSFFIFILLLTVVIGITRVVVLNRRVLVRTVFLGLLSFAISAYWIFPTLPQVNKGVTDLAETNSIDLTSWLKKTSNPISETLRLGQFNSGSFFPRNNPYTDADFIKPVFLALSFLPIMIILLGLARSGVDGDRYRKLFWVFFVLLVIFVALNARVRPPFEKMNSFFFHLPGINALRSYEKIAIFTPFLLATLLALTLLRFWTQRFRRVAVFVMVIIILLPLPFYVGKLQQNMSFILSQRSKDFQKSSHSFLVKIPEPYYGIQDIINNDTGQFKIASLPYNTDKFGWVSYPTWKMRGNDILAALYKAPLINPNSTYAGSWIFAKDFNEQNIDPIWIANFLGLLNTKYIIYHKDVHEEFLEQSLEKMQYLRSQGVLIEITDNEYFTLYELEASYVTPYVYTNPQADVLDVYSVQNILDTRKQISLDQKTLDFEVVHPRKIIVSLPEDFSGKNVILSERYDTLWQATYYRDGMSIPLEHESGVSYANAWLVKEGMKNGYIVIEYTPMKFFFIGAGITGFTLLILAMYIIYSFYGQRRKKV